MKIIIKALFTLFVSFVLIMNAFSQDTGAEWGVKTSHNKENNSKQAQVFRDGNYAMFIHWGLYSQIGNLWKGKTYYGIGEWIMEKRMANIPINEMKEYASTFNPSSFDAKTIVQLAKDAGMKYIVLTTKHHDGFAMYHSKVNKFNIVDATPFKRDPLMELATECKKQDVGLGFYYSHNVDWTAPGASRGPTKDDNGKEKNYDDYMREKCLPQLEEITTQYGPIQLVWFDQPGNMPVKYAKMCAEVVRKNQPDALVSGRVGYGLGDYTTLGDMEVPIENVEGMWESVDVTNDSWGYAWYDQNWKSPKQILKTVLSTIARGGTLMMNVGLDGKGQIPEPAKLSLLSVGKWIQQYPQVVYGVDASPWKHALPWGDVVRNGQKLYLVVYDWSVDGKLYLPGLKSGIDSSKLLNNKVETTITFKKTENLVCFNLPSAPPDKFASVLELTLTGEVKVDTAFAVDPNIGIYIPAKFAVNYGNEKADKQWMEKFGEWKTLNQITKWSSDAKATWDFETFRSGYYKIDISYTGVGKIVWKVRTDEGEEIQNQQNSSHIYSSFPIGWIKINKPGKHNITVTLEDGNRESASVNGIKITPVEF
ncbi:MAG: alpha-L-fucosidase [Paludibacter sp.]|nr:alpha-L-fucosidase [Paludibacter sp.]